MEKRGTQDVQAPFNSFLAGPSYAGLDGTVMQAHRVTTNNGDFVLARGNVNIQKYYNTYPDPKLNTVSALRLVKNLRNIHLDVLSKATPGTGIWLLKTEYFILWLDFNGDLKILWGTGIPGAGKSVMASIVIKELEARAAAAGGSICVCYVYFRYSDGADLTIRNVLEILVKQTVERHPDCALFAEEFYAQHLREDTQPTEGELLQLLQRFTKGKLATFYILDALDEAPEKIQVDLVQKLASLNIRLFVTSRPLEAVQARLPNAHCFHIVAQEGDLDLHITQEISRSRDLANLLEKAGSSLRDEIVTLVKSKCGGMFLHASLQLDALCECMTAHDVRRTLEGFPSRMEDVYRRTWQRILEQKPRYVLLAKTVLVWVLNASRSMTIEELACAVATAPNTYKFEADRLAPGTTLMALCLGLVICEEESRLVRLVHYTAKETLQGLLSDHYPLPHSHLSTVCMAHLMECSFQNTTIQSAQELIAARRADPLLAYASDAWAVHARQSLDDEDSLKQIVAFVRKCDAYPTMIELDDPNYFDVLGPFHVLAIHNLPVFLLTHGSNYDTNVATQIDQDSPLTLASYRGHKDFVKVLLACPRIQVNFVDKHGQSALIVATRKGHECIVKLLLAHPDIQVNLVEKVGWSALMLAAHNGHKGIVNLLLACSDIQVNLVDNEGWSALMEATRYGYEGVVELLLAHPEIQINLVDEDEWPALSFAASKGDNRIVKLLLARPEVQVNLASNKGWSALMLAARHGYEGIVVLLLAHPEIQVNLVDDEGWSALMKSAYHGHEGIVRLLLAHPMTQVDLVDCEGCSALMLATRNGHEGVVKQLHLRTEIQVNLVDDRGFSALMLAAKWGHEAIVRLLLSVSNANTASRSVDKEFTAMSLASANDHMEIVQILQEFGLQHASLPRFTDSTVKYTADPGLLSVREHLDEEMSEYVGDKAVDDEGAEDEGENNDEVRDPPPGSKGDAKRSRDNEEVLVGLVDDVAPPARKRRRGSQKAHDRWA